MTNAYFQVEFENDDTYITFYPATDGGEALKIDEVIKFLEKNQIKDFDLVKLNQGLAESATEVKKVFLIKGKGYAIRESIVAKPVKGDMFALARFYPPSKGGERMTADEIKNDLKYLGITYGVDDKVIENFVKDPHYCTNYVIAKGKPVIQGTDANIEYHFSTNRQAKPKRQEDGSVDFHDLQNISHIKKGDVLATLTRENTGEDGITVRNVVVKPRPVTRKSFHYGRNISVSADGLKLISEVNGHVILEGDKVFVSDVYEVPAHVDNSTGDINYEGNVLVHGTVKTGFKIVASGDVEVMEAVEGAEIYAGGQIILHHGMQGMGRGILKAEGNIVAKFIESAKVVTGGFLEADSLIQCDVSAKGDVVVNGKKGFIIGGTTRSTTMVFAKTIGSDIGVSTVIDVGIDPALKEQAKIGADELKKKSAELAQAAAIVDMYRKKQEAGSLDKSKLPLFAKSVQKLKEIQGEIEEINERMAKLMEEMGENDQACIKVLRDIYSGVKIVISEEQMNLNQSLSHCKFQKERGLIKIFPL